MDPTSLHVAETIGVTPMTWRTEYDLQLEIERALTAAGIPATREVHLGEGIGRIDLMAGRVGIEVKVGSTSTWADVTRQLGRYAWSDDIDELVLVTTTAKHRQVPGKVAGVPVRRVFLLEAGL